MTTIGITKSERMSYICLRANTSQKNTSNLSIIKKLTISTQQVNARNVKIICKICVCFFFSLHQQQRWR